MASTMDTICVWFPANSKWEINELEAAADNTEKQLTVQPYGQSLQHNELARVVYVVYMQNPIHTADATQLDSCIESAVCIGLKE